jgi:hypothetical protein
MFRLTSAFSVKSVIRDIDVDLMADQNALLLLEEFHDEEEYGDLGVVCARICVWSR